LQARLPNAKIDSAGTSDWHIGSAPYGPAQAAALARGHDLSQLRARQVAAADFTRFDLILAMDDKNLSDLRRMAPPDATAQLALFLEHAGGGSVPDPYYTRDFDGALDLIDSGAAAWAEVLKTG